jgi:hypothetical protein
MASPAGAYKQIYCLQQITWPESAMLYSLYISVAERAFDSSRASGQFQQRIGCHASSSALNNIDEISRGKLDSYPLDHVLVRA